MLTAKFTLNTGVLVVALEEFAITVALAPSKASVNPLFASPGIVKKCAVEENPKSEIDRYQAA